MDVRQQASQLMLEADQVLASGADSATMHVMAQSEALKISSFLQGYGAELDAIDSTYVDGLGARVDKLTAAASGTLSSVQRSALATGVSSFISDESSLDDSIVAGAKQLASRAGEAVNEGLGNFIKTPGGKIAAAVVAVLVVAYVWRAFK